ALHRSSSSTISIFRPWMPPSRLTLSYHIRAALTTSKPYAIALPESGANIPSLMVLSVMPSCCWAMAGAASAPASPSAHANRLKVMVSSCPCRRSATAHSSSMYTRFGGVNGDEPRLAAAGSFVYTLRDDNSHGQDYRDPSRLAPG